MLEAYEMEEMTIDEIIAGMMGGMGGQATPMASEEAPEMTLESMVEMVKEQYLGVKLSEMMGDEWDVVEEVLGKIEVNALSASFGAKYGDDNKVNYIEMAMDVDFDAAMVSNYWDEEAQERVSDVQDMSLAESFTVKISNISASAAAIDVPEELEDAEVWYDECDFCDTCDETVESYNVNGSTYHACPDCAEEYTCSICDEFCGHDYIGGSEGKICYECKGNLPF